MTSVMLRLQFDKEYNIDVEDQDNNKYEGSVDSTINNREYSEVY